MKKVLFLGCNHAQLPYLKLLVKAYYVIGTDLNQKAPGAKLCHKFYNVGYLDFEKLIDIARSEGLTSEDYVFTAAEQFAYLGVSAVSEYIGKHWLKRETIELILNKQLFYEYFALNEVPYPETKFICTQSELAQESHKLKPDTNYYLKSDRSKNPLYIYKFDKQEIADIDINWVKDRFLVNGYVLQEEFIGEYFRVNFIKDRLYLFDFQGNRLSSAMEERIIDLGIAETLLNVNNRLLIDALIVKYDVLVNGDDYVVLDIGIDHPSRLSKYYLEMGHNFAEYYTNQYLLGKYLYPND